MRKKLFFIYIILILILVPSVVFAGSDANPGDIVINEFMVNPTITNTDGEWIEIHNTTGSIINIDGWVLSDDGPFPIQTHTISNGGTLNVPSNGKIVLCINESAAANGGVTCHYEYGIGFGLGNGADEIVLTEDAGTQQEIARVNYTDGAPFNLPGQSAYYIPSDMLPAGGYFEDNGTLARWGATEVIPANLYGTSLSNYGTPGTVNNQSGDAPVPTALTLNTFTGESANGTSLPVSVAVLLLVCSGLFVFWRSKKA